MNDLQKLLRLRKTNVPAMAEEIGHGYHSVQKTIKGIRKPRHIQEAIAMALGLTWEQAFGPGCAATLKKLIRAEIAKERQDFERKLTRKYLPDNGTIAEQRQAGNG